MHIVAILINTIAKHLLALLSNKINVVQYDYLFLALHIGTGLAKRFYIIAIVMYALFL
jgi:hypothetical protein